MNSRWRLYIPGALFSLAAISLSFMIEALFFDEWPWWAWGLAGGGSLILGVRLGRSTLNTEGLSEKAILDLKKLEAERIRGWQRILDKNTILVYLLILWLILWVLQPLVRGLVGADS